MMHDPIHPIDAAKSFLVISIDTSSGKNQLLIPLGIKFYLFSANSINIGIHTHEWKKFFLYGVPSVTLWSVLCLHLCLLFHCISLFIHIKCIRGRYITFIKLSHLYLRSIWICFLINSHQRDIDSTVGDKMIQILFRIWRATFFFVRSLEPLSSCEKSESFITDCTKCIG